MVWQSYKSPSHSWGIRSITRPEIQGQESAVARVVKRRERAATTALNVEGLTTSLGGVVSGRETIREHLEGTESSSSTRKVSTNSSNQVQGHVSCRN